MEADDIAAVIDGFGAAAALAVASGCDGVEVNAGQYSLVRQFLSGLTNQRDDEWGTDKLALARAVLRTVRAAIGPDAVLSLRLSCDELAPWAGLTPESAADVAAALVGDDDAGVDVLTVVRGSIFSTAATRPDGHEQPGFNIELCRSIRTAIRDAVPDRSVAVVAQGSIVVAETAAWVVGEGDRADAVEMTRALLADADLVAKFASGLELGGIRPCILCNQTCQVRDARNPVITCVVDPRTGHELDDPDPEVGSSPAPTDVLVVGGGVAGMEAARVAARRGHPVRLLERSDTLGGAVITAAMATGRGDLANAVTWLAGECTRASLDVDIVLGHEATVEELAATDAHVIIATGSVPGVRDYTATRAGVVLTASEVLDDVGVLPDGPIVVWDPIGGPIAVSVAETLAGLGRSVALCTPDNIVGNELSRSGDLAPANARLQQAGVELHRRTLLRAVKKGSIEVEDRFSGERRTMPAAALVDCGHRLPDDSLAGVAGALRVGDAVAPRTIHEAILEGRRAALAIDGIGRTSDGVPMGDAHH
jgi:2,4-dienoyl-CoA reductase (NADPH2)